jgi:hypothetical protein
MLVSEIETLCRDAGLVPGQEPLDSQIDSFFEASSPSELIEDDIPMGNTRKEPLDDRAIRDAFLRFFCSVLGGYERYLVVPDVDFLVSGEDWFDSKGFLASVSEEKGAFLGAFVSTQLFQSFIQRRTEASDVHCLLFDECLAEYHSSTSHSPYGRLGGDVETIQCGEHESPQMLYSLLVDQSATESQLSLVGGKSFDTDSRHGSDTDSSGHHLAKSHFGNSDEFAVNATGDWVTVPSRQDVPTGSRFVYCIDGNATFPDRLNPKSYLPRRPESWLLEMSTLPTPMLTRSDKEIEEADRRRRLAASYRGLQSQRRCLWQLPKLMVRYAPRFPKLSATTVNYNLAQSFCCFTNKRVRTSWAHGFCVYLHWWHSQIYHTNGSQSTSFTRWGLFDSFAVNRELFQMKQLIEL